ncbi:MAG TPA: BTAD domain-containing putative transcriptional regulator [Anaerolineae bacterium]|nr:BTAD domain-containing putative transcriptional regulator [Anaerolineae bacterium]
MSDPLKLSFLGTPQVTLPTGETAKFTVDNALLLLAYLVLNPSKAHRREELAALFYTDSTEKQASQNLRQTLKRLRQTIKDDGDPRTYLLGTIQSLQFNTASQYWLDVNEFNALIAATQQHRHRRLEACRDCMAQLAQAVELYRGDLLEGIGRRDDSPLIDWLETTRDNLQRKVVLALHALARHYLARRQFAETEQCTTRLLHFDALDEEALRLQIHTLVLRGERNQALKRYRQFRNKLQAELDLEPSPETVKMARAIQAGNTPQLRLLQFQRSDRLLTYQKVSASALPNILVPFVGRGTELQQIARYLASQDCRLITLVGPGGVGKTRLAMRAAADDAPEWIHGAWLASLDDVAPADLEVTIAGALGLATRHNRLRARLYDHLREKELLLLLDNFEQLMSRTNLVKSLLDYAPDLKIIVTSREQLGIRGEQVIQVKGLKFPNVNEISALDEAALPDWSQTYSAIQLFLENARRVSPGFWLGPHNLPAVTQICQQVAGLPLAIELASAWVRIFSCDEIATRLEQNLTLLRRRTTDVPGRHASMEAVFEHSWNLLSDEGRDVLRKLAIFRGKFSLEAAETVALASPDHLAMLLDKSLLRRQGSVYFDLHPLLRQYAFAKLAQRPQLSQEMAQQHGAYYLNRAATWADLYGQMPDEDLADIQIKLENIDAAVQWATTTQQLETFIQQWPGLAHFLDLRGQVVTQMSHANDIVGV